MGNRLNLLQEWSAPLILGVLFALWVANTSTGLYAEILEWKPFGDFHLLGHMVTFHFLVNDIFMVFFFGIAAKEITESFLPGGDLNPVSKAINPLIGTIGGVLGPIAVFFVLTTWIFSGHADLAIIQNGWGIPTATDIALAWLVARMVLGKDHPAVKYLLLLAVLDDAIGLVIIAKWYPDPNFPVEPIWLLLVAAGMAVALILRKKAPHQWKWTIGVGGGLSWTGLMLAHIHPALALVPIVPFLLGPKKDTGMYAERDEVDIDHRGHHSPLHTFEESLKTPVDYGLFFFAFCNAGVQFDAIGPVTWIILASLIVGKTIGISLFSIVAMGLGAPLPEGMKIRHVLIVSFIAGLGLTVALFVTGEAYPDGSAYQAAAKMGALFSGFIFAIIIPARILKKRDS